MPVVSRAYERKLFDSCRILFGPTVDVGWDFLFYIQISGVKNAFRQRALLTHPDRALLRGEKHPRGESASFIVTKDAYDNLLDFIRRRPALRPARPAPARSPAPPKASRPRRRPAGPRRPVKPGYYYSGNLPRRRLLLGEYLFYSGAISWEALIKAIVWQRRQRPRLGDIASRRGWIKPSQVRSAALRRKPGVPIGEALIHSGILQRWQVETLLWRQRRMQSLMGEYFTLHGLMTRWRLDSLARRCQRHNETYSRSPGKRRRHRK